MMSFLTFHPLRSGARALLLGLLMAFISVATPERALAQEGSTIPDELRGSEVAIARGILDGNLIETNYRNHGEFSRWDDVPWGVWPRGIGGRHIDGIAVVVAALIKGDRSYWGGRDTLLDPVVLNFRGSNIGTTVGDDGSVWGWLPLPGFHNTLRVSANGLREPVPAISTDPTSWPTIWPDKLQMEDAGWPGSWNGLFGKGVFNADQETFYVMDDMRDRTYQINPLTGSPYSQYGVFYPDHQDSTKGGLALQVQVRALQWSNILAEDVMFLLYRITNTGATHYGECIDLGGSYPPNALEMHAEPLYREYVRSLCPGNDVKTGLFFTQFVDFGLGEEEGDELAAYDPLLDVAYGWDRDGIGTPHGAGQNYPLGYVGFAFLESPANDIDGQDNDQDGIIDEHRFTPNGGGAVSPIVGRDNIRNYINSSAKYDLVKFEQKYGRLEDRPAYVKGVWWPEDENLDWVGYTDANGNGVYDVGELINDDYGRDGLGPFDFGYTAPDEGEGDGRPTAGEPNFDQLDVDESDQIGLTGFHLSTRSRYQPDNATNMTSDRWMWDRIRENQFEITQEPAASLVADIEPFVNFSSGPVNLGPQETDFFSTAWIFGEDAQDFFKNRQTVQNIYNADYRFAQPPIPPTLKAEQGDGFVVLSWDTLSLTSWDRFTQCRDFEGYKLYRGTDELLSDARTITDVNGIASFYKPIARWDKKNGIVGRVPVYENTAFFDLGTDTGLEFSYIDRDVTNGKTYYYALVAYDHGTQNPECVRGDEGEGQQLDPQENTFNVRRLTTNVAVVVPRARAAGYVDASTMQDLSTLTEGRGTGSAEVTVVNSAELDTDAVYRVTFFDSTKVGMDVYTTTGYELRNITTNEVLISRAPIVSRTPVVDGFVIDLFNDKTMLDMDRSGWMGTSEGETVFNRNPARIPGLNTNWFISTIKPDTSATRHRESFAEYELRFSDTPYTTPTIADKGYLNGVDLPFSCYNVTADKPCGILAYDQNQNGVLDLTGDTFILSDLRGNLIKLYDTRYQVGFAAFGGESRPPAAGAVVHIGTKRPFARGDFFQFTMASGYTDEARASEEMDRIAVVPNPYVAAAEWEPSPSVTGRGPRMIQFIRLPETCTIKIYTLRGELVRTLYHEGVAGDGAEWWDLLTEDNQEVAYGVYYYHVKADGIGEKTGKFALIK